MISTIYIVLLAILSCGLALALLLTETDENGPTCYGKLPWEDQ